MPYSPKNHIIECISANIINDKLLDNLATTLLDTFVNHWGVV